MKFQTLPTGLALAVSLATWAAIILLPLVSLYFGALKAPDFEMVGGVTAALVFRTLALAGLIATAAVILGYVPGRVLGGENAFGHALQRDGRPHVRSGHR